MFKAVDILGFEGLLCGFTKHPALYPHLNPLSDRQIGALGNKYRRKLSISGTQNFIVERLVDPKLVQLEQIERIARRVRRGNMPISHPMRVFLALLSSSSSPQSRLATIPLSLIHHHTI